MASSGPPYAPTTAILGGQPTPRVDDPICAVLLLFYVAAAATHMTIFQINRKRGHKFIFSALLFGFCMSRLATLSLRIAWASHPQNVNLIIAATIFVQAGVLLLFIVNLVLAQRIVRSYHPKVGWSKWLGYFFKFLYFCVGAMLVMVIYASVDNFFTLDAALRARLRVITLVAGTYLALIAFLPLPIALIAVLTRPRTRRPEKFGQGRLRVKLGLLLFTSFILSLGAGFRVGINYTPPRPRTDPAWFDSKACFYCFNFVIELLVVYAYAISRFDRRFHIPNGSSAPGHYSGSRVVKAMESAAPYERTSAERTSRHRSSSSSPIFHSLEVNREDDVAEDYGGLDSMWSRRQREIEWERRVMEQMKKETVPDP